MLPLLLLLLCSVQIAEGLSQNSDSSSGGFHSPWIVRTNSSSQYQFNFDENGWLFAREKCLAQNADLIAINDMKELEWVMEHYPLTSDMRERFVLIGLKTVKGGWSAWLDGSPFNTSVINWALGEPKDGGLEECVYMSVNAVSLNDLNCDVRVLPYLQTRYICERTPAKEAETIPSDELSKPLNLFIFLQRLGKLKELRLNKEKGLLNENFGEQIDFVSRI